MTFVMARTSVGLGSRRILAWLVDWAWTLLGALTLFVPGMLLWWSGVWLSAWMWNAISFVALVAPSTFWLAWRESTRGATPGKMRFGLQVVRSGSDEHPTLAAALARNGLKVALPWQLGHTMAYGYASPAGAPMMPQTMLTTLTCVTFAVMALSVAGLFIGSGRTWYDVATRNRVSRPPFVVT